MRITTARNASCRQASSSATFECGLALFYEGFSSFAVVFCVAAAELGPGFAVEQALIVLRC